ncbi:MAG TPA: dihydropteroate synthase [Lachnospiraceae bacterium]|nr:dihydropteroate synthase [Lachnospiraceae bacterium]
MKIGNRNFDTKNNVYIMGILNVTPDSFSDGGKFNSIDQALFRAEEMQRHGVDIIDIGGESTRPNHTKISVQEEIERVAPIIEKIKENIDIPISLDSYKSEVISANIDNIDLINDIWGLKYDPKIAEIVAKSKLPCCLMHNRKQNDYVNFFDDFLADIDESLKIAKQAGIDKSNIIIDGGVGFQKTYEQNLEVINKTEQLAKFGCPIMLATSRKSVIGLTLNKPIENRVYGTLATTVIGVTKGASFVRVHDIEANIDAIKMTKSILGEQKWTK